ncbi:hypothetical protein JHK82_029293 [Glycine max]|nr:hypothetical protein JHK82_029293 [Glycine max]
MDSVPADVSNSHTINDPSKSPPAKETDRQASASVASGQDNSPHEASPRLSPTGISSWAKNLKISQPFSGSQDDSSSGNVGKSTFARITSNFGLRLSPKSPVEDDSSSETAGQSNLFGTITKGLVDSSKNAVKAVQVKARHVVSQNKRRYQEGGFDLDMTYITENIIAMGFPAGDMSSGFFGYVEDKYKVYNLCSERLYDASLFEGKVASFPFDDHNCPPIQLIISFCQSAYSWLKEDIENVVVVHCKAGMARTGLMISSLLVFLKFFPTAEESMDYYNQKRCVDGKGLVLPSQIDFCDLSFHNLQPEDFWFGAPKKGVMVFALPGEPGLTELAGDFKIHFHDRQGDFYCWLNTTMTENRKVLNTGDLDGFDKRKLPSPGFMVEVVLVDYNGNVVTSKIETTTKKSDESSSNNPASPTPVERSTPAQNADKESDSHDKDDVFSDGEAEQSASSRSKQTKAPSQAVEKVKNDTRVSESSRVSNEIANLSHATEQVSLGNKSSTPIRHASEPRTNVEGKTVSSLEVPSTESEFKAMAADASVFTFGDDEDYESD